MIPTLPRIRQQAELSLKTRAPLTYQEMTQDGTLTTFLDDLSNQMEQSYQTAFAEARTMILSKNPSPEEAQSQLYQAQDRLWEQTQAEFLDFADSPEQKAAALEAHPEVQKRLRQLHARWMKDCPEKDREEMESFWQTEQRQTSLNRILDELEMDSYAS